MTRARDWLLSLLFVLLLSFNGWGCSAPTEPAAFASGPILFTPDLDLQEVTLLWAGRWSAATGLDLQVVEEGGIPIVGVDEVVNPQTGELVCGATHMIVEGRRHVGTGLVQVDTTPAAPVAGCPGWGYILGHEMGHAIGARGHCDTGIMSPSLGDGVVHEINDCAVGLVLGETAPSGASDHRCSVSDNGHTSTGDLYPPRLSLDDVLLRDAQR